MGNYSVKQLAVLAGISVRTLHLYDDMGLLRPAMRTDAGYRRYGRAQLLRLQQILFYRELDIPLQQILDILDDPGFDLLTALKEHRSALQARLQRIATIIATIDNTIATLNNDTMLTDEQLYNGFPREEAEGLRTEAITNYGADAVHTATSHLRRMSEKNMAALHEQNKQVMTTLYGLMDAGPADPHVQQLIRQHYGIMRIFWGTAGNPDSQLEAYKGLGELYVNDERFILTGDEYDRDFAVFMSKAMACLQL